MKRRQTFASLLLLCLTTVAASAGARDGTYHPGHYVALPRWADDPEDIKDALRPGVTGVQKRFTWRELEPGKGQYDLSGIEADLSQLADTGHQLVVFVFDKSFKDERYTPDYLWDDYTLSVNSRATGKGYVAKRWDPYVVERFNRLMSALARFDDHPAFEGVAIQETALGVSRRQLAASGYAPERYRDALIAVLRHAAAVLPRSRVFWYANFLPGDQGMLGEVAQAVAGDGVAIGGPDVLPDRPSLVRHVYPFLRRLPDDVVVFNSVQNDSYQHRHRDSSAGTRYWTPAELLEFARAELGVRYLFWNRVGQPRTEGAYDINDAYPVMAANPL